MKLTRGRIVQLVSIVVIHALTLLVLQFFLSGVKVDFAPCRTRGIHRLLHRPGSFLVRFYRVLFLAARVSLPDLDLYLKRDRSIRGGQLDTWYHHRQLGDGYLDYDLAYRGQCGAGRGLFVG